MRDRWRFCDCFASRRAQAAKTIEDRYADLAGKPDWKGVKTYGDFRELLADKEIDGVVIATPDHWHVPLGMYAVAAGKDVYIEKPLGVAMRWAWKLRELINKKKAVFQYGTQQRSSQNFRFACELVRNGYIGELQRIEAWCSGMRAPGNYKAVFDQFHNKTAPLPVPEDLDYEMWLGPAPKSPYCEPRCTCWGTYHVYDNALGFIAGWGAHPLDIAQWGNNSDDSAPVSYEGTGTIPTGGLFDTIAEWDVHCRYANGVKMRFMDTLTAQPVVTYRNFHDHGTTFFGTEGWVSVDRAGLHFSDPEMLRTKLKPNDTPLYVSVSQQGNFVDGILNRQPTINSIESAVNSDLISHLSDIAIRLKRKIEWNPKTETIINDAEATERLDRPLRAPWKI